MIYIKHDKGTIPIPENWNEVTFDQFIQLEKADISDFISIIAVFTGLSRETIENSTKDFYDVLWPVFAFIDSPPHWEKIKKVKRLFINGKYITPPKKVEFETFGQRILALYAIRNEDGQYKKLLDIVSIYLVRSYYGNVSSELVEELKPHILKAKAIEIVPFALFFFNRLSSVKIYGMLNIRMSKSLANLLLNLKSSGKIVTSF
jgi:hypothetical protein